MKKEILKKVLTILFKQNKIDDKKQEATYNYYNIVYPNDYAPILDWITGFQLEALKPILWDDLTDWIEYFLYEAESFYPKCEIGYKWKEYTISSDTDAILWLVKIFWK